MITSAEEFKIQGSKIDMFLTLLISTNLIKSLNVQLLNKEINV